MECQPCLAVCPTGARSIFGLNPENSLPLRPSAYPSFDALETLVRGRRSVRQYREDHVPRVLLDSLLATLAHAPTGCNDRALDFLVLDDRALMGELRARLVAGLEKRLGGVNRRRTSSLQLWPPTGETGSTSFSVGRPIYYFITCCSRAKGLPSPGRYWFGPGLLRTFGSKRRLGRRVARLFVLCPGGGPGTTAPSGLGAGNTLLRHGFRIADRPLPSHGPARIGGHRPASRSPRGGLDFGLKAPHGLRNIQVRGIGPPI